MAGAGFSELGGDAKAVAGAAQAAIEHICDGKLLADLGDGHRLVAKCQHSGAWQELQLLDLCQLGDDVFRHAVAEVFIFLAAAEVREVEHGDGFLRPLRGSSGALECVHLAECLDDLVHRGAALARRFREAAVDELFPLRIDLRHQRAQGRVGRAQDGIEDVDRRSRPEREGGRVRHLVEQHAEGEDVAAGVDRLAAKLLRRHVGNGATGGVLRGGTGGEGLFRLARRTLTAGQLGEAEIEDLHAGTGVEHDVAGLDVAVIDAGAMGIMQAFGDLTTRRLQIARG